ncbi:TIGR02453 family protein [Ascidiimonas sp. W6]|uniref:DUF2461 domain-containing protein n=1 Tax=Ascidiimonas meishanensis TaxID=3128903 RepID=UPI0030EF9F10
MITSELLKFLTKLEKNNNREWFENHKNEFRKHQSTFKNFNEELLDEMKKHDEIEGLKVFRIYRDVRFSKNKTPYKSHLAASFKRIKPKLRGGYYLQIKPKESFIATGFWDPVKEDLLRIRKELEIDAKDFNEIIKDNSFVNIWGPLEGDEVKTAPKGFSKTHPNIELIRKKQFIFSRKFTDAQVCSPDFLEQVNHSFKGVRPFFDYMTEVLTTDLNGVSLLD